jgi:hypothetical protein
MQTTSVPKHAYLAMYVASQPRLYLKLIIRFGNPEYKSKRVGLAARYQGNAKASITAVHGTQAIELEQVLIDNQLSRR